MTGRGSTGCGRNTTTSVYFLQCIATILILLLAISNGPVLVHSAQHQQQQQQQQQQDKFSKGVNSNNVNGKQIYGNLLETNVLQAAQQQQLVQLQQQLQQQQQQQQQQSTLQQRKYYHHYRYNGSTKVPTPQMSGIGNQPFPNNLANVQNLPFTITSRDSNDDNNNSINKKSSSSSNNDEKVSPSSKTKKKGNGKGLELYPTELHFPQSQLCIESKESFEIINHNDFAIQILSIQTESQHFETDFIRSFMLKGGERVQVMVMFNPKWEGEFSSVIEIQLVEESGKSKTIEIPVGGKVLPNFYHLKPIREKVIVENYFTQVIQIYNPNNETLYIRDIYTTGSPFMLSLANQFHTTSTTNKDKDSTSTKSSSTSSNNNNSNSSSSSKDSKNGKENESKLPNQQPSNSWELAPYTKSNIITLYFKTSLSGYFNGYVYIDTNLVNLSLLVTIQSISSGIHILPDVLNFGTITSKNDLGSATLVMYNADQPFDLHILEIRPLVPDPRLRLLVHEENVLLGRSSIELAHFFYIGDYEGEYSGTVLIKIDGLKDIEIPYRAIVLHGDLSYHPKDVLFPMTIQQPGYPIIPNSQWITLGGESDTSPYDIDGLMVQEETNPIRKFTLKNNFDMPLTIHAVQINDPFFLVKDAPVGITVNPNSYWPPIKVQINPDIVGNRELYENIQKGSKHAPMYFETNITNFEVNLHAYNRLLTFYTTLVDFDTLPESQSLEKLIDFGVLSKNEPKTRFFRLKNTNPFSIYIACFTNNHFGQKGTKDNVDPHLSLKLLNIHNQNGKFVMSGNDVFGSEQNLFHQPCVDIRPFIQRKVDKQSNSSALATKKRQCISEPIITIKAGHTATFSLEITRKGLGMGESSFSIICQFENLTVSYKWNVMNGSLEISPSLVHFGEKENSTLVMMSGVVTKPLYANSTFSMPVNITSIDFSDQRVKCTMITDRIEPHNVTHIANLWFDPSPSMLNWDEGRDYDLDVWKKINGVSTRDSLTDMQEHQRREEFWDRMGNIATIKSNIYIHTDLTSHHTVKAVAKMAKPILMSNASAAAHFHETVSERAYHSDDDAFEIDLVVDFGMVRVHQDSFKMLEVYNPLDVPISAQLVMCDLIAIEDQSFSSHNLDYSTLESIYELKKRILETLQEQLKPITSAFYLENKLEEPQPFDIGHIHTTIQSTQSISSSGTFTTIKLSPSDYRNSTAVQIIPPHSVVSFGPIRFTPLNSSLEYRSVLYLKNNYTIFQPVQVLGVSAGGKLEVVSSNHSSLESSIEVVEKSAIQQQQQQNGCPVIPQPASTASNPTNMLLLLELNKTHLAPCIFKRNGETDINSEILIDSKTQKKQSNSNSIKNKIEVTKSFTIMNKGDLSLDIKEIFINDFKCNGFGFKVLNCNELKGLNIKKGEMVKLVVSYEPDFSTSLLKKDLVIKTNQEPFIFSLIGSMPHEYLPLCTHLQPSLFYEYPAKIVFIICMVILFFVLSFFTFREYSKPQMYKSRSLLQSITSLFNSIDQSNQPLLTSQHHHHHHHGGRRDNEYQQQQQQQSIGNLAPKSPDKTNSNIENNNSNNQLKKKKKYNHNQNNHNNQNRNDHETEPTRKVSKTILVNNHNNQVTKENTTTPTSTSTVSPQSSEPIGINEKIDVVISTSTSSFNNPTTVNSSTTPLNQSLDDMSMSSHEDGDHSHIDDEREDTPPTVKPSLKSSDNVPPQLVIDSNPMPTITKNVVHPAATNVVVVNHHQPTKVVVESTVASTLQPSASNTGLVPTIDSPFKPLNQQHTKGNNSNTSSTNNNSNSNSGSISTSQDNIVSHKQPKKKITYQPKQQKSNDNVEQAPQQQPQQQVDNHVENQKKSHNKQHVENVVATLPPSNNGNNNTIVDQPTIHGYKKKKEFVKPTREQKKFEKPPKQPKSIYVPKVQQPVQPATSTANSSSNNVLPTTTSSSNNNNLTGSSNSLPSQPLSLLQNPFGFGGGSSNVGGINLFDFNGFGQSNNNVGNRSPTSSSSSGIYNPFSVGFSTPSTSPNMVSSNSPQSIGVINSNINNNNINNIGGNNLQQWFAMNNLLSIDSQQPLVVKNNNANNQTLWKDHVGVIGSGKVTTSPQHVGNNSGNPFLPSNLMINSTPTTPIQQQQQQQQPQQIPQSLHLSFSPSTYDLFSNQLFNYRQPAQHQQPQSTFNLDTDNETNDFPTLKFLD